MPPVNTGGGICHPTLIYEVAMSLTLFSSNNLILQRLSHFLDFFWLLQYLYPEHRSLEQCHERPSTIPPHVMWMGDASGAKPPTRALLLIHLWPRQRWAAHINRSRHMSGARLLTWLVPFFFFACHMFDSHFLVYCWPVSEKNRFVRDQSDDVSEEGYYYFFFWLMFVNKNIVISLHFYNVLWNNMIPTNGCKHEITSLAILHKPE